MSGNRDAMTDSSKSVRFMQCANISKIFTKMKVIYSDIKSETKIFSTPFRKLSFTFAQVQ